VILKAVNATNGEDDVKAALTCGVTIGGVTD
jgi:hypothetical protein